MINKLCGFAGKKKPKNGNVIDFGSNFSSTPYYLWDLGEVT